MTVAPITTFPYCLGYLLSHPDKKSLGCHTLYLASIALTRKFIHNINKLVAGMTSFGIITLLVSGYLIFLQV